ncbi:MAG: energy transducer TonB [Deltaproteobacteria bacterium]|nr:energy transducer TonB [Deltaproteobacteria bacterium]
MSILNRKVSALVFSAGIHCVIFILLVFVWVRTDKEGRWSGGRGRGGYQVAYVDLGKIGVTSAGGVKQEKKITEAKKLSPSADSSAFKIKRQIKSTTGRSETENKIQHQQKKTRTGSGTGNSTTPAGGTGPGLDADGIIAKEAPSILANIRKKIMSSKDYPLTARENNLTGSVRVSFKINRDGLLEYVTILSGSGHDVLDKAALKTIRRAVPLPYYPKAIALDLEYRLE